MRSPGGLGAWLALVQRRARAVLAVLALAVIGSAVLVATRLGVDTDSSRMLAPDLPFQERAHALNAAFPAIKNAVLVVVRAEIPDAADAASVALAERLRARGEVEAVFAPFADPVLLKSGLLYLDRAQLDERLAKITKAANLIATLRSEPTFAGFLAALGEALSLAERAEIGAEDLQSILREAAAVLTARLDGSARPFSWARAFAGAEEGPEIRTISVIPRFDFAAINPAKATIAAVREEIAALDPALAALVEIGVTGDPVLRAEELRSVTANIEWSLLASLVLVALLLWLCFRSWARAGLLIAAILVTLVLTAGFAALAVGSLNLISVAFIVLMVGLGVDFAIHLLAHAEAAPGASAEERLVGTGRRIGGALALAAATTALAFLAFATTDFVGMAQLGLIGGAGVLIAFGVTVTLLPAAMALRPALIGAPRQISWPGFGGRMPLVLRGGVVLLTLGALAIAPQARFDADPMALRSAEAPSVVAFGWLAESDASMPYRVSLLAPTAEAARAAAERASALEGVGAVSWAGDLVPGDQEEKLLLIDLAWPSIDHAVNGVPVAFEGDRIDAPLVLAERLRAQGGAGALALADALERLAASPTPPVAAIEGDLFRFFPQMMERFALQLEVGPLALADLPSDLVSRFSAGGIHRVDIAAPGMEPQALIAFAGAVSEAFPELAAGGPVQIAGAAETVSGAMLTATLIAFAATGLVALAVLQRGLLVLAILVPLLAAAVITAAASVLLEMPFNYANVIVLPLLIGYGIDSGIHIALAETRRAAGVDAPAPTRRAVVFSALTTAAAFGTLALSDHPGTASMGALLTVALAAAMLTSLTLTAPLVRLVSPRAD